MICILAMHFAHGQGDGRGHPIAGIAPGTADPSHLEVVGRTLLIVRVLATAAIQTHADSRARRRPRSEVWLRLGPPR